MLFYSIFFIIFVYMNTRNFYLNKICNIPFTDFEWDIPDKVVFEYIKRYRKELTLDELIDFLSSDPNNIHNSTLSQKWIHGGKMDTSKKLILLINVFNSNDFNYDLQKEDIGKLHEVIRPDSKKFDIKVKHFTNFINFISKKEIFTGEDLNKLSYNSTLEDLYDLRSFKIYQL